MFDPGIISAFVTFVTTYSLIYFQRRFRFSQLVREDGPESHLSKKGTPSVGGLAIYLGQLFSLIPTREDPLVSFYLLSITFFAMLGLFDDILKILKIRNGFSAKGKFLFQFLIASFLLKMIPFEIAKTFIPGFGMIAAPAILLFFVNLFAFNGTTNATNLTDGLDGLLTMIMLSTWICIGFFVNNFIHTPSLWLLCLVNITSLLTFLWFNCFRASIFMGDCGSLFLGAGLCSVFVFFKMPLLLIGILFVPVVETLSVMIQVTSFRLRKRRIFKMAPLHHHFEQLGYHESLITVRFALINTVCCLATLYFL